MFEGKPYVVVVQTHQSVIDGLREQVSPFSHNHIIYTTNPGDVLCELLVNPVDIIVSGQHFYQSDLHSFEEVLNLYERVMEEGAHLINEHYKPPISGPCNGSELCREVHRIKSNLPVFRFSLTPDQPGEFAGDIPKEGNDSKLVEFLESPFLSWACAGGDWESLIKLFPNIIFYEQNLR